MSSVIQPYCELHLHVIYVFLSLSHFIIVNLSIKAECPMAGNKHALIRYRVLDACFSNRMRKYCAEDLISKCNEALAERYGTDDVGISRRTFFDDLNDLDSIVGEYGVVIQSLDSAQ